MNNPNHIDSEPGEGSMQCDYLVVGGGPAGATSARLLAQAGKDVIVIEQDLNNLKPCGGGVKRTVFEEFSIPETLEYKRIVRFNLYSPSLKKVGIDVSAHPISIVDRREFDRELRELAVEAGARLVNGRFKSLKIQEEGVEVTVADPSGDTMIRTRYLIAADGAHSTVRKKLFGKPLSSVLTHYKNIPGHAWESCDFYFGSGVAPHHYGWVFPHKGEVNIGVSVEKTSYIEPFSNRILPNQTKTLGYPIPLWTGERLVYREKVFFVGDAAGQVLPFTYEGIYYAMRSAKILSDALNRGAPAEYATLWEEQLGSRFRFFRRMQKIFLWCDWMAEKMISLFAHPSLQAKALQYWSGTIKPLGMWAIVRKTVRLVLR